jgi:integrase
MTTTTTTQFPESFKYQLFSKEQIAYLDRSKLAEKFLIRRAAASVTTARGYRSTLQSFSAFVLAEYKEELDDVISKLAKGDLDPYDVLSGYAAYMVNSRPSGKRVSPNTVRQWTIVAKKFLRVSGVKSINNDDFKDLVTLPRKEHAEKYALERKDVIEILNACKDIELKTLVLMLASTGGRAMEVCSLRVKDINLEHENPKVSFRKEFSKMLQARTRPLTSEVAKQLGLWLKYKYRPHRTTIKDSAGNPIQEYVEPEARPDDLLFGGWHPDGANPNPSNIAVRIRREFARTLQSINKAHADDNGRRRAITLHSFRRFCKTAISNQGYQDFSEWYIGHGLSSIGQTYFRASRNDTKEIFHRIEPALTFLDAAQIEAYRADIISRLQKTEDENVELRKTVAYLEEWVSRHSDKESEIYEEQQKRKMQTNVDSPIIQRSEKAL